MSIGEWKDPEWHHGDEDDYPPMQQHEIDEALADIKVKEEKESKAEDARARMEDMENEYFDRL